MQTAARPLWSLTRIRWRIALLPAPVFRLIGAPALENSECDIAPWSGRSQNGRVGAVRFWLQAALLAGPLSACDDDGPRVRAVVQMNDGTLCLLQEGERVSIYALSGACGCSNIRAATCEAAVAGDRVVVTSRTLISTNRGGDLTCPGGCYTCLLYTSPSPRD